MNADDATRLGHMVEAAENVAHFAGGRKRADLDNDLMLTFAVLRAIEIFGEAAARLSAETRAAAPDVPWAAITAMRNRLVHAYFDIDHDIVWTAATEEIPALLPLIRSLLARS